MISALARALSGWRQASRFLCGVGVVGLLLLCMVTLADILMRKFLQAPLKAATDIYLLLVPIIVASFLPSAFAERQHVTLRFLGSALRRRGMNRSAGTLELFGEVIALALLVVLAQQLVVYTLKVFINGQASAVVFLPIWPSWTIATVVFVLSIPEQLVVVWQIAGRLRSGSAANA